MMSSPRRKCRLAERWWFGRAISLQSRVVSRSEGLRASRAVTARRSNVQFPRSAPPSSLPASRSTTRMRRSFVYGWARNLGWPISVLPEHIEEIIRATVKLYADHHRAATRVQLVVARMVDLLGRPGVSAS